MKYILENDVEEMELYFVEEEYDKDGQLLKVDKFSFRKSSVTANSREFILLLYLLQEVKNKIKIFLKHINTNNKEEIWI